MSETNPFGKMELDKVIEVAINCDKKTSGGTTSFSRSNNAVNSRSHAPYKDGHATLSPRDASSTEENNNP